MLTQIHYNIRNIENKRFNQAFWTSCSKEQPEAAEFVLSLLLSLLDILSCNVYLTQLNFIQTCFKWETRAIYQKFSKVIIYHKLLNSLLT